MSRPFAAFEDLLERILERPAARLFHARPQPVQLERRIERAMTAHRMVRGGRTYVPSRYRIALHPTDLAALHEASDRLAADLAEAILLRARSQGYWLVSRPEVLLVPTTRIDQGDLEVDAEPLDPSLVSSAAAGLRPVGLQGPRAPVAPMPGTGVVPDPVATPWPAARAPVAEVAPVVLQGPVESALPPADAFGMMAPAKVPEVPEVPKVPKVADDVVRATIEIQGPDVPARWIPYAGGSLRIGRGTDNDIVVLDGRVSRHHGRLTSRHGVLVYTDLDSTNGTLVNGVRVREAGLGVGDVVGVGRTTLTIRPST